jgi:hypothetical protein
MWSSQWKSEHKLVHKGEIVVKPCEDGGWLFLNEDGRPYKGAYRENAPAYEWNTMHSVHESQGIHIVPNTAVTRWRGERMDYDLAMFALFSRRDRMRNVAAETPGS